jgi:hypothetical protein
VLKRHCRATATAKSNHRQEIGSPVNSTMTHITGTPGRKTTSSVSSAAVGNTAWGKCNERTSAYLA